MKHPKIPGGTVMKQLKTYNCSSLPFPCHVFNVHSQFVTTFCGWRRIVISRNSGLEFCIRCLHFTFLSPQSTPLAAMVLFWKVQWQGFLVDDKRIQGLTGYPCFAEPSSKWTYLSKNDPPNCWKAFQIQLSLLLSQTSHKHIGWKLSRK